CAIFFSRGHINESRLVRFILFVSTMVDDALIQQLLHDLDGSVPVRGLLVLHQPVDELLSHKAVGVRPEVVPAVFDHFTFMKPEPGTQSMSLAQASTSCLLLSSTLI